MKEADKRVPPVGEPTAAELASEIEVIKRDLKEAALLKQGEGTGMPSDADLQKQAKDRLRARAETARQDEVMKAYFRVREQWRREAFKRATAKTMERKIREAILARRLEAALTKEDILYLYLNTRRARDMESSAPRREPPPLEPGTLIKHYELAGNRGS